MATKPKSVAKSPPPDMRGKIVDALMELAAERRFEDISMRDICKTAGVSLADFRDAFPSKGAVLAGFVAPDRSRRPDAGRRGARRRKPARAAVRHPDAPARSDGALSRRPARDGRVAQTRARRGAGDESGGDVARCASCSRRPASKSSGAAGVIKLQGLALAWARIVHVWLDDDDPALSKTMAELDRVLTRGERAVAGVDRLNALASPFPALAQAAFDAGTQGAARRRPPVAQGRLRRRGRDRALNRAKATAELAR